MPTPSTPATPVQHTPQIISSNAPTGTWKHPRFEEITRRLEASTFNDRNIKTIFWSCIYLALSLIIPFVCQQLYFTKRLLSSIDPRTYLLLVLFRILLLVNIAYACLPLIRKRDDLSDIPLTPSQRALLGLAPTTTPATPGSQYITPPRYSRSSTPRSNRSMSGSPYSGRESPLGVISGASPYSASPLLHKAVSGGVTRRLSYGTPSPSGINVLGSESSNSVLINTPSPLEGRRASIGLNGRWLYERSKGSPSMRAYYS